MSYIKKFLIKILQVFTPELLGLVLGDLNHNPWFTRNGNLKNLILSILIINLTQVNLIKKTSLIMLLMNSLLKRAPLNLSILSLIDEDKEFWICKYKNSILRMSEDNKTIVGSALLEIVIEQSKLLTLTDPIFDSKTRTINIFISINEEFLNIFFY